MNLQAKNLHLKAIRIVLSYVFLVAGIYAALSLAEGLVLKAVLISVVWFILAAIDEIVFWKLVERTRR